MRNEKLSQEKSQQRKVKPFKNESNKKKQRELVTREKKLEKRQRKKKVAMNKFPKRPKGSTIARYFNQTFPSADLQTAPVSRVRTEKELQAMADALTFAKDHSFDIIEGQEDYANICHRVDEIYHRFLALPADDENYALNEWWTWLNENCPSANVLCFECRRGQMQNGFMSIEGILVERGVLDFRV